MDVLRRQLAALNGLLTRTDRLIKENVATYEVAAPLPLYPINRHLADAIRNDQLSERVKVIN